MTNPNSTDKPETKPALAGSAGSASSPLPFGVHRVSHAECTNSTEHQFQVSIAFRRSPRFPPSDPAVGCSDLLAALRDWRQTEKRHALIVLGEIEGDVNDAKDKAHRSLHNLRIQTDKVLSAANS